jgi:hypothetical protein
MSIAESNFAILTETFEMVAAQKSVTFQQYLLTSWAAWHGLPRGEMRRLYRIWTAERAALLVGGDENV